jgi:hypothetical protein
LYRRPIIGQYGNVMIEMLHAIDPWIPPDALSLGVPSWQSRAARVQPGEGITTKAAREKGCRNAACRKNLDLLGQLWPQEKA